VEVGTVNQADNSRKILVVDDNRELCENLRDIFDLFGHHVTCAFDGHQAVASVTQEPPQVILMDVQMPSMDGITALKEIKQLAPEARILLMTGHHNPDLVAAAMRAGAAATLSKPLDYEQIHRLIAGE
jgi:DNA-binding NtrC family response regulator